MRADRRHELKESDLRHALETGRAYLQKHGKGMSMLLFAAVAVVVVASLVVRSREATAGDHWRQRRALSFEPDVAKESLDSLMRMANESRDAGFVLTALIDQGAESLQLATEAEVPQDRRQFNETARRAYETLRERFPNNPLAFGIAHRGLATVEETAFALDGDSTHKERAQTHLTAIIDNPALHATPFYRMAQERREALDATFTQVVFAPPLPPEEASEEDFAEEPDTAPRVPIDLNGRLQRVDPPEWAKDMPMPRPGAGESSNVEEQEAGSTGASDGLPETGSVPPPDSKPANSPPDDSGTREPDPDGTP